MIDRQEIMDFAREMGLDPNVIEKDYVLGWLLAGITNHPLIAPDWVFKGGTCLKKCYFETYCFSEDLDFTITDSKILDTDFLTSTFTEIAEWVYEQAGIEMPIDRIRFTVYDNTRGQVSAEGRIGYRGPLQRRGDPPRIKLDLTADEVLVFEPSIREIHHPYSDRPKAGIFVQSYCFEEVFAEKIRALTERERPRDLYDVVHLYRHDSMRPDCSVVMAALVKKCEFKGVNVPTLTALDHGPERVELESEWENMLAHQLPVLPPFNEFWQQVPGILNWLQGGPAPKPPAPIPVGKGVDATWFPPAMAQAWHTSVPLEPIRFAAANRLCVNLEYQGSRRLIEPYSLRRTQDGNLLLFAVKHDSGESRSYRVDRIQSAKATNIPFVPRFALEISSAGLLSIPPTPRQSDWSGISTSNVSGLVRGAGAAIRGRKAIAAGYGPTYVIQCSLCGKKFSRKKWTHPLTSTRTEMVILVTAVLAI